MWHDAAMGRRAATGRWLALGAATVGVLDIAYAMTFHWLRSHVPPLRILQSIAAGLLGRDAASHGGIATGLLGLALHFFIATVITVVFHAAASRWPALLRRPWLSGACYGVGVWAVMNFVVIPLSRIGPRPLVPVVAISGLLVHVACIGWPIAWASRRAARLPQRATTRA